MNLQYRHVENLFERHGIPVRNVANSEKLAELGNHFLGHLLRLEECPAFGFQCRPFLPVCRDPVQDIVLIYVATHPVVSGCIKIIPFPVGLLLRQYAAGRAETAAIAVHLGQSLASQQIADPA